MKKLLTTCFTIVVVQLMYSQADAMSMINNGNTVVRLSDKLGKTEKNYTGSPYLFDDFKPSKINNLNTTFPIKYDIYNDSMLLQQGNEIYKFNKDSYNTFIIDNIKIELINNTYYIVLAEKNNIKFLKKEIIKLYQKDGTGYSEAILKYTKQSPEYYIFNKGTLSKLDKNFKNIDTILPEYKEQINKNNQEQFKSKELKLIALINSL